jgi:tripartite-type tricarboxylate transporter receptor subunit TctC
MTLTRTLLATLATLCIAVPAAHADEPYPNKPIRLIVPYAPGGSTDATARIVGEAMSEILHQQVVIENKPGGTATIGIDLVAKSKPDGYTLGVSGIGATVTIPLIDPKLNYSPLRDLDIIAGLINVEGVIVARPTLAQNNITQLLDYARANPGKVTYGTAGVAGPAHLGMEHLQQLAKVKMLHIPFSGDSPAITAVLTGDVDIAVVAAASATPFLTGGKLKALAANGPGARRLKLLPDLLSVTEQTGFKEYQPHTWSVLVGAKGTPPDIIATLNKAVNKALETPEVKTKLENYGLTTLGGDAASTLAFVKEEIATKKKLIEEVGLKRQ